MSYNFTSEQVGILNNETLQSHYPKLPKIISFIIKHEKSPLKEYRENKVRSFFTDRFYVYIYI